MIPPQRVPLVEGQLITREWLKALEAINTAASTADLAVLTAAIAALTASVAAADAALDIRLDDLEAAALAPEPDEFEWDGGFASARAERMQDLERLSAIEQGIWV